MRGRPPLPIGQFGNIKVTGADKKFMADCHYRDLDGVTRRVRATGTSKTGAANNLKSKLAQRRLMGGEEITPESTVALLAEAWFKTVDQSQSTKDAYRYYLDKHVIPSVGNVRLREATTARLDTFLRGAAVKGPAVGKQCRVVLSLMFGMASRYDAVPVNPVTDTKLPRVAKKKVAALSVDEVMELRADVFRWASQRAGRDAMVDVVDLFIATGLRPGELLALRYQDVDLKARTLTVSGTVKRDSVSGLHRQPYPKTESGERTLTLPDFAVSMIRRRKLASSSGLLFPNRNGDLLEPANFRRTWREVRGEKWAEVEPRSFRKAVATLIEREADSATAAAQLGHSSDAVTRKHYIQRNEIAPDSTLFLQKFRQVL